MNQEQESIIKSEEKSPAVKVIDIQISPKRVEEKPSKAVAPVAKKKESFKPKWALTEQQVKDEEDQDVDDLLQFTNNLDYDQYINDMEVKTMVVA